MLLKWKHIKWVLGNMILRWWVSVETHRWNEASQVICAVWWVSHFCSCTNLSTCSTAESCRVSWGVLLWSPSCQAAEAKTDVCGRLAWTSLVWCLGWAESVHWLLGWLGCWVRTCQVCETGWVSGADLSTPHSCPHWESRNRHLPVTRCQHRDLFFSVSMKKILCEATKGKVLLFPAAKSWNLYWLRAGYVGAENRTGGTNRENKQWGLTVGSDSGAAHAIGSPAPVCPAVLKLALWALQIGMFAQGNEVSDPKVQHTVYCWDEAGPSSSVSS